MHLGMVIWAIGLMLTFQSAPCIILGVAAVFCFWTASKREDEFNIEKFGEKYQKYMGEVSRWNVFKGLKGVVNKRRKD